MARPQKFTPDQVLDRATELFWKEGAGAVSTRNLEAALGLRASALYRRFGSRHGLLAAAMDHYVDRVVTARITRVLDDAPDPVIALHRFFHEMLEPHGREPLLRGCLLTNTAGTPDGEVAEVRAALDRGFDVIRAGFARQIDRAVARGRLPDGANPKALTAALFISLQGVLTLARAQAPDLRPGIDATFEALLARSGPFAPLTDTPPQGRER